jgi:hypothetical protein
MGIVRKIIIFVLIAVAVCSVAWLIFLDFYFYACSSRSPDPTHGFVYPVNVHHGTTVYLNSKQFRWFSEPALTIYFTGGFLAATFEGDLGRRRALVQFRVETGYPMRSD